MGSPGNLERLKIIGYADADRTKKIGTFIAPINPSSITMAYGTHTDEKGTENKQVSYSGFKPPQLSLDLLLDGTGAMPIVSGMPLAVPSMVELFKQTCYYFQGSDHDIPYVEFQWGAALMTYKFKMFSGRLSSLNVSYSLFNPEGIPIRGKITATFAGSVDLNEGYKLAAPSSPDLTHKIMIKAGDSLPNLCMDIYGDPKYYHQIAQLNKLANFRELTPGMELEFPPLK